MFSFSNLRTPILAACPLRVPSGVTAQDTAKNVIFILLAGAPVSAVVNPPAAGIK